MTKIYTAQYRYSGNDRLDITVKGNHPLGKIFAPTWSMVLGVKRGDITKEQYDALYQDILASSLRNYEAAWEHIATWPSITLVCFCPTGSHCHRYALANAFVSLGYGTYQGERLL